MEDYSPLYRFPPMAIPIPRVQWLLEDRNKCARCEHSNHADMVCPELGCGCLVHRPVA